MKIFEIFDLERHLDDSRKATQFLNLVRKRAKNYNPKSMMYFRNTEFEDITLGFPKRKVGDPRALISDEGYFFRLIFPIDTDVSDFVKTDRFESSLRHEFQHYLDIKNKKFSPSQMHDYYKNKNDDDYYHNSDVEYESFFKQQAEPLLKILRGESTQKIDPDFESFIRDGQHISLILKDIGGGTTQRYKKFDK